MGAPESAVPPWKSCWLKASNADSCLLFLKNKHQKVLIDELINAVKEPFMTKN
jgi:hypothetical protein